jgi:Flp pilus assembly protein TadD
MTHLARAHDLAPGNARYGYVYAVALHDLGRTAQAIRLLTVLQPQNPTDRDLLVALASFEQARGNWSQAIGWAEKLQRVRPDDAEARALADQLRQQAAAARRR